MKCWKQYIKKKKLIAKLTKEYKYFLWEYNYIYSYSSESSLIQPTYDQLKIREKALKKIKKINEKTTIIRIIICNYSV